MSAVYKRIFVICCILMLFVASTWQVVAQGTGREAGEGGNYSNPIGISKEDADRGAKEEGPTLNYMPLGAPLMETAVDVLNNVTIEKGDGDPNVNYYYHNETMRITMEIGSDSIPAGSYTVITLPKELEMLPIPNFVLRDDAQNQKIADVIVNAQQNSLTLIFDDGIAGMTNIKGSLQISATGNGDYITESKTYELEFYENKVHKITGPVNFVRTGGTMTLKLYKKGKIAENSMIQWTIHLNFEEQDMDFNTLVDEVAEGHKYVPGSMRIIQITELTVEGMRYTYKGNIVTSQYDVVETENGFSIEFETIRNPYLLTYYTVMDEGTVQDTFKNEVTVESQSHGKSTADASVYWSWSGEGSGERRAMKLVKKDEDSGELLKGAEFELYNKNNQKVADLVTDENGEAAVSNLNVGATYTLKETKAPEGYPDPTNLEPTEITISAEDTNEANLVVITNQKAVDNGVIILTKIDGENQQMRLSGAAFQLFYDPELTQAVTDGNGQSKWITENGEARIEGLTHGTYYLRETVAPENYMLQSHGIQVAVGGQEPTQTELVVKNYRENTPVTRGSLQVIKQDAQTQQPLTGAVFNLEDMAGEVVLTGLYTGDTGVLTVNELEFGEYYLQEIKAPDGYQLPDGENARTLVVVRDETPVQLVITNQPVTKETLEGGSSGGESGSTSGGSVSRGGSSERGRGSIDWTTEFEVTYEEEPAPPVKQPQEDTAAVGNANDNPNTGGVTLVWSVGPLLLVGSIWMLLQILWKKKC